MSLDPCYEPYSCCRCKQSLSFCPRYHAFGNLGEHGFQFWALFLTALSMSSKILRGHPGVASWLAHNLSCPLLTSAINGLARASSIDFSEEIYWYIQQLLGFHQTDIHCWVQSSNCCWTLEYFGDFQSHFISISVSISSLNKYKIK